MSPNLGSLSKAVHFCKELHIAFTSDNTCSVQKKVTQVIMVAWQWVTKQLRSLEFHREEPLWNFEIMSVPEMFLQLFQVLTISSCTGAFNVITSLSAPKERTLHIMQGNQMRMCKLRLERSEIIMEALYKL